MLIAVAAPGPSAGAEAGRPALDLVAPSAAMLESVVNPDDELMAVRVAAFVAGYQEGLAKPDAIALERAHPGISKYVADALIPIFKANVRAQMRTAHRRFTRFFEANFSAGELSDLMLHFASSKGPATIATIPAQASAGRAPRRDFTASATYAKFMAALPTLRTMQTEGRMEPGSDHDTKMRQAVSSTVRAFLATEEATARK